MNDKQIHISGLKSLLLKILMGLCVILTVGISVYAMLFLIMLTI